MFRFVLKNYFKNKVAYILLIIFILIFIINVFMPYLNGQFIDFLLINKNPNNVIKFSLFIMMLGIISIASSYFLNVASIKILNKTTFKLIDNFLINLMRLNLEKIEKYNTAYLTQRIITDVNTICSFVIQNYLPMILNGVTLIITIILFIKINPLLLILVISFIPIYSITYIKLKKPLYESSIDQKEAQNMYYNTINKQLSAIIQVKIFNSYSKSKKVINKSSKELDINIVTKSKFGYIFSSIDNIIETLFRSFMFLIGGISILKNQMSIGEFTIINSYFSMIISSVKYYINFLKSYQDSLASFVRLNPFILGQDKRKEKIYLSDSINSIRLDNVNYSYNSDVFKGIFNEDINLFLHGQGIYSIIGDNGSGKSTLFKIIIGLYSEYKGKVIINGLNYKDINLKEFLNNNLAAVPQDLKFDSVKVKDYLDGYINSQVNNPLYLDSIYNLLNKDCDLLSGGEARKIALFKALNKKYDILILDEPTTGLDINSKKELVEYLNKIKEDKLIILFTHDEELISISNKILNL